MNTVLGFIVTLGVLIVVHEWGHYAMARLCGVKVLRFSVGFGRPIWRRQRGDTEFVVAMLPLGGYVRMLDEREDAVLPHEREQAFNRKSLAQRSAIVAAGPIANLTLAVLLFASTFWIGVQEPRAVLSAPSPGSLAERAGLRSGDVVTAWARENDNEWTDVRSLTDLRWQIMQAALDGERLRVVASARTVTIDLDRVDRKSIDARFIDNTVGLGPGYSEPVIGDPVAGGPAERAGLKRGDRVLRIDGLAVADAQQLRQRVRQLSADGQAAPMVWTIDRAGQTIELTVQPRVMVEGQQRFGRIDAVVGRLPEMTTVRLGPLEGLQRGASTTWEQSVLAVKMFGRMLIGQASLKNLSGPITIADYAGQSVSRGLVYYLGFLALVSVGLGVLNLLPVPLLDGGHLMYYLFEAVTGRPVSELWIRWLQRGGALLLLLLMSLALSNDVARLLGLH